MDAITGPIHPPTSPHLHHFPHTNLEGDGVSEMAEKPLIKRGYGLSFDYRRKSQ